MRRSVRRGVVLVLTALLGPIGVLVRAEPIPIATAAARLGAVPLLIDEHTPLMEIEGVPQLPPAPDPAATPATGPYDQLYPGGARDAAAAGGRTSSLEALLEAPDAEPASQPGWSFDPVATLQVVGILLLLAAPMVAAFVYLLTRRRSWRRRLDVGRHRRRSHRHRVGA